MCPQPQCGRRNREEDLPDEDLNDLFDLDDLDDLFDLFDEIDEADWADLEPQCKCEPPQSRQSRKKKPLQKWMKKETCMMAGPTRTLDTPEDVWLGDSAASAHMGKDDEGMHDVQETDNPVTVGNGKVLRAPKVGKLRRTLHQKDGSTMDVVLQDCKCVLGLKASLFSTTRALDNGWKIDNDHVKTTLAKKNQRLVFDRTFKTDKGKLCRVELLKREETIPEVASPVTTTTNWDINRMHKVFNHASEEVLRATAKGHNWTVSGKFEACKHCQMGNVKQKGVPKTTGACLNQYKIRAII